MPIRGIDVHTHVCTPEVAALDPRREQKERYFHTGLGGTPLQETADMYRGLELRCVLFGVDTETRGGRFIGNDYVARCVAEHPDVFIGFGSVDPWKGKQALQEAERCVRELGMRGMKFAPITQAFYPNDPRFYPLWDLLQSLEVPALVHTGHTGIGAGEPGGTGLLLDYSRPIPYLDQVAADFPKLQIISAHPGWPWHDEQLSMALHKSNVWIDLSGWSPKYFPPSVVQHANTRLQDRMLFGSDYPLLTPERWLRDFEQVGFKDEVRPKILLENAKRLLQIE